MTSPQLLIRSAKARSLALRLAKKECCSISQVVERALEFYAKAGQSAKSESAGEFWDRMNRDYATDIDLESLTKAANWE